MKNSRASLTALAVLLALTAIGLGIAGCGQPAPNDGNTRDNRGRVVLTVAYSSEKAQLFQRIVDEFNKSNPRFAIEATALDMTDMQDRALAGDFTAISPDSAIWLGPLDNAWLAAHPDRSSLIGSASRYALSPVVIAAWDSTAKGMGYPSTPVGWTDIVNRALSDQSFRWGRPSPATAAGLLTTTAEFYAALGKTSNLTHEDLDNSAAREYVRRVEKSVQQYGAETEDQILARLLSQGSRTLDAFVCQEQLVVQFNRQTKGEHLVAIYPSEGTLWMDHPLVLLENGHVTPEQRRGFQEMVDHFRSPAMQQIVLQAGYRPADLRVSLDDPQSQIKLANGVDPAQPYTMLQMPGYGVLASVRDLWALLKHPANIYLVIDTSGSMEGDKLTQAQEALLSFIGQIKGDTDRVALVSFSSKVVARVPLGDVAQNRLALESAVRALTSSGNTALNDAILYSVDSLQKRNDPDRINAVLVMSDGQENASQAQVRGSKGDASRLVRVLADHTARTGVPVMVFTVAYGDDADLQALQQISDATHGYAYKGDPATIQKLYQLLSAFF